MSHPCSGKSCPPGKKHSKCDELAVCQRAYPTDVVPGFNKMSAEQRAGIRKVLRRLK